MYKLEFAYDSKSSRGRGQGRGRGRGAGRLQNCHTRNEPANWRDGGGRGTSGSARGNLSKRPAPARPARRPKPELEEEKCIKVQLQDMIYHAFLPKRLPENAQEHLVDVEEKLLEYVISGISDCITKTDGFLELGSVKVMMERWKNIQPKWRSEADEDHCANSLKQEILNQTDGDVIPIYVRKQNCTLLIHKLDEKFTQLLTFRTMLCSETVMSSVGSQRMSFPQTCDAVYNKSLLTSDIFLYHIHQLSVEDFELSLPSTKKGTVDYRGVPSPVLLDLIIGLLCPAKVSLTDDKPLFGNVKIWKKIKDQVNCQMSSRSIPFRRSGFWLSVKVALMLKLVQDIGDVNNARFVYKLIMLHILTAICEEYAKDSDNNIDLDLSSQLIAKLGRRVSKLKEMPLSPGTDELMEKITLMKQKCLEFCNIVVGSVQNEITGLWRRASRTHPVIKPIVRSNEDFKKDLLHEIQWLDQHILASKPIAHKITAKQTKLENLQKVDALRKSMDFQKSLMVKRYKTLESILKHQHSFNSQFSEIDDINERIWVYDVEFYIKHSLDADQLANAEDTENIQNLIIAYFKNAVPRYISKTDPSSYSQMILVILKALLVLDKICTDKYPLLLQYSSGVKIKLFDKLLLPHQQDVLLLDEISDYFASRNEHGTLPSLIESNRLEGNSFQVRFARENEAMCQVRQTILRNTEVTENAKIKEVKSVKAECEKLAHELRARGGMCKATEMDDGEIHDNKKGSRNFASITCKRCKINSILKFKRLSVNIYERPLPTDEYLQFAVIFELKIPSEICLLRDMLALLNFEIMGERLFGGSQTRQNDSIKPPPMEDWRAYMKRKGSTDDYKSKPENCPLCIDLVSPRLPFSGTCNAKIENPDVLVQPIEKFVVDNDLDCVYYHEKPLWFPIIKHSTENCTFQLCSTCQPDSNVYGNLQWTVASTQHSQNQVIAGSQVLSHPQLSPKEYLDFGSVRADSDKIQLRNLYRVIYDRALSLQKEPVLALTLQVLWQVGPRNENGVREYLEDFLNDNFSFQFLDMLTALVETCEGNYSEPFVLMLAVVITVRILEMNANDECQERCYHLLKRSRSIIMEWRRKIETNLVQSGSDDEAKISFWKARLLEAVICCMFSYHVSSESLLDIVMQSQEDYNCWFHSVSLLYQLTEEEQCHQNISHFVQTLLNIAKNIPLKLELEKRLKSNQLCQVMLKSLHLFTCDKWSKVNDCDPNTCTWKLFSEKENPHLVFGGYKESSERTPKRQHFLSLDLIQGTFLVNGFPQTTLPLVIRSHPLFKRYFKNCKFRIQRYSTCARTRDKFHGRHYDFEMILKQNNEKIEVANLIIREIQEDDASGRKRVLEMLESVLFKNIVGNSFVENYTHWLDANKRKVYFRRLPKQDSDYSLPYDYVLCRDEDGSWRFYDERQRKYLLSTRSNGFKLVTDPLSRLESKEEINVLLDIVTGSITAKLPRYNLSFSLVDTVLHSVEYKDFRISENQNLGTLIGLCQGVLLELGENPDRYSKRRLIVPHGYLGTELLSLKYHHNTVIDLNNLRKPPFFEYEYDTVLLQLKADKSLEAWLYLAALHATTSSSLPDPFTQITGTERCLEILKSGHVWPTEPYNKEALESLGLIRDIAPKRSYYAHGINFLSDPDKNKKGKGLSENMEITQWCDVIPSMAAYDAYPFIVDKLIESSGRLMDLHGDKIASQKIERKYRNDNRELVEESEKLQLRSYQRYLSFYNQAAILPSEFFKESCQEMLGTGEKLLCTVRSQSISSIADGFCLRELQIVSQTRLVNTFEQRPIKQWGNSARTLDLELFLISDKPIAPLVYSPLSATSLDGLRLKDLLNMEFKINWLQLYTWAINKECRQSPAFTIILSALAYRGVAPLQQIMHLHHISCLSGDEEFPQVPAFAMSTTTSAIPNEKREHGGSGQAPDGDTTAEEDLIIPTDCKYELEEIQTILESNMIPLDAYGEEAPGLEEHLKNVRADAIRIAFELNTCWPCQSIPTNDQRIKDLFKESTIRFRDGMDGVNKKIACWYRNLEFNHFIEEIQRKLLFALKTRLDRGEIQETQKLYSQFKFSQLEEIQLHVGVLVDGVKQEKLPIIMENRNSLEETNRIFETGHYLTLENQNEKDFIEQRKMYEEKLKNLLQEISEAVQGNDDEVEKKIIYKSGVAPRVKSTLLLQYLMDPELQNENGPLWVYVGALGVLWTHLKRLNRCIALQQRGESAHSDLKREEENLGHEDWSPKARPDWLLLELELDIMIRRKQVCVAQQMMRMPNGKNGVMQLNMGEGKTSVIVPMICTALSRKDALCRITVLSSIFKTNLNILRFAIGGLLNRRVYTFPCTRNVPLNSSKADKLLECLEECLKVKGVILTVPEHRFSFRLLALDKIIKREFQLGTKLRFIEDWLRYYCRDILDESDELLNVKYQLVYSCGSEESIDGESLRWTICQKILDSVRRVAEKLQDMYNDAIEFDTSAQFQFPERFATCRLISEECFEELRNLVAEDMLSDLKLEGVQRVLAKLFMTEEMISEENHDLLINGLQNNTEQQQKVLLVSAYLRRDILTVALRKRWRVEYGVNSSGERLMAVPFRAKDVAAERNEFSQPDLAIVLTHLSYYYSGLSDDQLKECFLMLKGDEGEEIHDYWIRQMHPEAVHPNARQFQHLNLTDPDQSSALFKSLRKHKSVIDFWLSRKVFPRESKQFPGKLICTGWDLTHERNRHPTTGFSGTNDSKDLLPLTTCQQDLKELQGTNDKVEDALLQPQNNQNHKGFSTNVTCQEILTVMKDDAIKILIDAGAIMLECDNEQVAELWLESDPDIQAVIYFGEEGDQMVKCRNEAKEDEDCKFNNVRLEESPFKYDLEGCGVFLDDQHTRGVDLKFPDGSRACVTVGSKMKREKLVQACLRMRKLLSGEHFITFYLSHEAHCKINGGAVEICTEDILDWVRQNTQEFIQDGLPYLCLNGLNYVQKLVAEDNLNYPEHLVPLHFPTGKSNALLEVLAKQCTTDEVTKLMEMYGLYAKRERLLDIIPIWFELTKNRLVAMNGNGSPIPTVVLTNFERIKMLLVQKCEEVWEEKTVFSSCSAHTLEEEQEKELEKEKETEVEEERQIQRAGPPNHFVADLHENVKLAVLRGKKYLKVKPGIVLLSEIFKKTTFWKHIQPEWWGDHVYATTDFARVIQTSGAYSSTNLYLRPIHWVASIQCCNTEVEGDDDSGEVKLLVLSPFEVNKLMPYWKKTEAAAQLHMVCRRRFQNQDLLVNKTELGMTSSNGRSWTIQDNSNGLALLSVASGNLYFASDDERDAYKRCVQSNFNRDPQHMVKNILSCRHPVLSKVSNVMQLLNKM